jgi:putative ATP-binding cassette transporter
MERINQALMPFAPALPPPEIAKLPARDAATLTLDGVCYQYPDADDERGFAFGPVSIDFPPGTITFVLGGNSSGKTTLIKLLAGLYTPNLGGIRLGGVALAPRELRENVSAIFADPYIFDRLYGWPHADPAMVNARLAEMGIGGRTRFVDGRFTSIDLSTGQRKRLAWVVAMIEARPILLLDQWAADQDPEFREHFYRVMLPELRAAGRSVIAVTNDDRYYDAADRLVRLDDGLAA